MIILCSYKGKTYIGISGTIRAYWEWLKDCPLLDGGLFMIVVAGLLLLFMLTVLP